MDRVAIVGKIGCGKTTLARELAQRLNAPHVELDSIAWGSNWTLTDWDEFSVRVEAATRAPRWVADGNYRQAREYVWGRADSLIWLDYPLWVALWRLAARTTRRLWTQEVLWGTNVERGSGIFGRDSLFRYAIKKHSEHRVEYPLYLQLPEYSHLRVARLRSPKETAAWLAAIEKPTPGLFPNLPPS